MNCKGKTVWITGAASGIGEALANEYSRMEANLILSDRDEEKLKAVADNCEKLGRKVRFAPFDLEKSEEIIKVSSSVLKDFPKIDILISNGGICLHFSFIFWGTVVLICPFFVVSFVSFLTYRFYKFNVERIENFMPCPFPDIYK